MRGLTGAFRQETGVAIDAVRHGLDVARGGSGADRISLKGGRDVVTGTDVAVEDVMRGILNDATASRWSARRAVGKRRPMALPTG